MLKRLPSAASITNLLRPAPPSPAPTSDDPSSSPSSSRSRAQSFASSALEDALSTTIVPPVPEIDPLTVANHELVHALESLQGARRDDLGERLALLAQIQLIMTDQPDTRNTFRDQGGFLNAVSVLASLEDGAEVLPTSFALRFELVQLVFAVLALAFEGNDGNRAAFAETVGFEAIGEAVKLSELMKDPQRKNNEQQEGGDGDGEDGGERLPAPGSAAEKLLSILYAFLINDFSSTPLFTFLRHQLEALDQTAASDPSTSERPSRLSQISLLLDQHADSIQDLGGEAAEFAEVVPLMLDLQRQLPLEAPGDLRAMVLCTLQHLAATSRRSQVALSEAGVVGIGLDRLFPAKSAQKDGEEAVESSELAVGDERQVWVSLVERLLELGADTSETRRLFQSAVEKDELKEEVLDLITHGFAFLAWLSIDVAPSPGDERLVIFGCGDATGKCHFELCITPDLQLSLSTSLAKPPIVFSTFTFSLGQFHHVAIVHQRPRYALASTVTLYVDGKLVEVGKASYPVAPPKEWEVQAWLGTPRDRVPEGRLSKGLSRMKWDLGPTWLIHGDLPEEMIYVCWTLGPRYTGNFQDQLGQFQTNASSTDLNIRLDAITRALPKSSRSAPLSTPLVQAIREKGSAIIPEHRIYFAFSALNVLVAGSTRGLSASGLSDHAQQTLALATASKGKAIVNSAVSGQIDECLTLMHGLGQLSEVCVANPKPLDVAIWKVGGIAVALRLIELAKTEKQLETTVQLFIEVVRESWRNSEDAERTQAYEILAHHLRQKASLVTASIHDALLAFCGFDFDQPGRSVVSNILAFRFLVLDFGLWGSVESSIQWAHFDRLRELIQRSECAEFNLRRMSKMHIVRKLLFALRANYFDAAMLDEVVDLLMLIVKAHSTTETVRHLATFLTATLCQVLDVPVAAGLTTPQPDGKAFSRPTHFILDVRALDQGRYRAPLRVLQGLHDLLLSRTSELQKFAKIITTKWMLLFLLDRHAPPLAAVLGLRILVRLLQTQGSAYVAKFSNSTDGFVVLRGAVPYLWNYAQIHLALFALLHDHDINSISLDAHFASTTFLPSAVDTAAVAPDVVRVIIACLGRGIKILESAKHAPEGEAEDQVEGKQEADEQPLSLEMGFAIVLEVFAQANRAAGTGNGLVISSPIALNDLVAALHPALRLPASPEYPPTATLPPLPLISSRNGYRLATGDVTIAETTNGDPLKLQIPTTPSTEHPASPLTALDEPEEDLPPETVELGTIGPAALSLLHFLSQQITHQITTRHVMKRSLSGLDGPLGSYSEPSLQILRDMFDAAASSDIHNQVVFRTLLVKDVLRRLTRASTAPLVSGRISTFLEHATDLACQGWTADVPSLLDFVLAYLEKLLDDTALGSPSQHSKPLASLYRSLNRLILLALCDDLDPCTEALAVLTRHQLTVFAPQNEDVDFIQCLIQRLDLLARSAEDPALAVDFFKLFVLQRPNKVEAALGQKPRQDYEVPFVQAVIDTDKDGFLALLRDHSEQVQMLKEVWDPVIKGESTRARPAVEKELTRIAELAGTLKTRRDAQRRRQRRQRASVYEWSEGVHAVESTRVAHTKQDLNDHDSYVLAEWAERVESLRRDGGLWPESDSTHPWQLDSTQGHCRMRKKLQMVANRTRQRAPPSPSEHRRARIAPSRSEKLAVETHSADPDASPPSSPITSQEEGLWSEAANGDAVVPDEAATEDKNRKVRRSLEPGDVIESVYNINRIDGLEACPGLLLLAKKNLYIVDSFFQTSTGELVDAWDAPAEERDQHLQTLADLAGRNAKSQTAGVDTAHRSRHWSWSDLLEVHERKYLFRNVAIELFFADGRSFLLTFDKARRATALSNIAAKCPSAVAFGSLNLAGASLSAKFSDAVLGQKTKLEHMTKRWEQRLVSNFEYLTFLNTISGRTVSDLTNYPVFPWVLADYESETLDLADPSVYRDLSKPMGAQTEDRRREFVERYSQLAELDDGTQPFNYDYSSAMTVVGYLVRLKPFTESYLDLQGGLDHADRMFWSIPKAWESSSRASRSDVRELLAEFYYLPDFLRNESGLELGKSRLSDFSTSLANPAYVGRRQDDEPIDNVVLPPWAKGDPRLFVELNRQALESDHVSANLHQWIDLIFGYKSGTGPAAVDAVNVFHHLSYEGAIDLDSIENDDERRAAVSTIANFGMTPRQLFPTKPHPRRILPLVAQATRPIFSPNLTIEVQAVALVESIVPVVDLGRQVTVAKIYPSTPDKTLACPAQSLSLPEDQSHFISWGFADQTVRIIAKGGQAPTSLFENLHSEFVSAACFADARTFVTASTDTNVSLWRWRVKSGGKGQGHLQQLECLRGHSDQVACVAASRSFSIVVSGSDDKTAIIWDLNRHRFVHRLSGHESRVQLVAISDTTGDIVTCSGAFLRIWTVNGELIATQATSNFVDPITAVAFSKSETAPIIATGHREGRIMLWRREWDAENGGFKLSLIHTLKHRDRFNPRSAPENTSLAFTARTLYAGDSTGKVWMWSPPGNELFLPDSLSANCMACNNRFTLMETRRRCAGCSGIFCSLCTTTSLEVGGRFCAQCFKALSPWAVI